MKEKIYNSVVVRFIESRQRRDVINHAPTNQARSCSIYRAITNQRGATLIMVAISMVVIFGFAVLAIDVSMMLLARTQLKNAADAASIAGAAALFLSNGDQEQARDEAVRFAGLNFAVQETLSSVIIDRNIDVDVIDDTMVTVRTHRTIATNDPVSLFFLRVISDTSDNKGNVTATSTAKVRAVCATDCVKPWAPPDRWDDADSNGVYDTNEFYDPWITGYRYPDDIGTQIILKPGESKVKNWPLESWYYSVDYPPRNKGNPIEGGDPYKENIWGCNKSLIEVGDQVQIEPGTMTGPNKKGLDSLYSLDPWATWKNGEVVNSAFAVSPRIVKACLFNPTLGAQDAGPGRKYVTVVKIMVIFIEGYNNQADITGRFMRLASQGENCDEPGSFLWEVALVPGPEEQ